MAQKQNPFYLTTLLLFGSLTLGIAVMLGILMGLNYTRSLAVEARGNVGQIYLSTPSVVYAHDGQVVTEFLVMSAAS